MVPTSSDAEENKKSVNAVYSLHDAEAKKHEKWNFRINILEGVIYFFGLNISSFSTIIPAYVNHFTNSNFIIGLIPTAMMLGFSLPQILASNYTRKLKKKKRFIIIVGFPQRIPWLILATTTFLLANGDARTMLVLFFVCFTTYTLSTGIVIPSWGEFVGTIITQERRGRLFGYRNFASSGLGVLAAMLANYILKTISFPRNFGLCFLLTFFFCVSALPILGLSREVSYPTPKDSNGLRNYFKSLPRLLANDRNYSRYLITIIIASFQGMVNVFYTKYAIDILHVQDARVAIFTAVLLSSQALGNLLWGHIADNKGHKIIIAMRFLAAGIAPIIAISAKSVFIYYGVFMFLGFSFSARTVSSFNILMEFAPREEKATYISLASTITAPFSGFAPILGGLLADNYGYKSLFMLSSCIGMLALFMLIFWVKEPRIAGELKGKGA